MLGAMDPLSEDAPKDAKIIFDKEESGPWQEWANVHDWQQYKIKQLFYAKVHNLWWPCELDDFFNGEVICFAIQVIGDN